MYNKKVLRKALSELNSAKAPKKSKDIITDPMGQWKHPGLPTRIPGNNITMEGVNYPVLGVANNGQKQMMQPGADYTFPGADYVDEYPQMRKGGAKKKKTKSLSGTNKLMLTHPLLRNYKNRVYDPNVDYFQNGGMKTVKSKDGTVTNKFTNADGDTVIQVKTKDGNYYEKVIPKPVSNTISYDKNMGLMPRESTNVALPYSNVPDIVKKGAVKHVIDEKKKKEKEAIDNILKDRDNVVEYYKGYHDSPRYKEMLQKSDPENWEDIYESRNANLEGYNPKDVMNRLFPKKSFGREFTDKPRLFISNTQPKNNPNVGATSQSKSGLITLYPSGYGGKGMLAHEYSHSIDRPAGGSGHYIVPEFEWYKNKAVYDPNNRLIPKKDKDWINKHRAKDWYSSPEFNRQDPKIKQYDWQHINDPVFASFLKRNKNWYDYVGKDTETRARLNDIRYQSKKRGIYDPFTEKVNNKTFKKILKTKFETDDKEDYDALYQLKDVYTDDEIQWMLNNISKKEDKNTDIPYGQDGGYIEAELTPEEIEEYRRGGYIVEDMSVPELTRAQDGGEAAPIKIFDGINLTPISKYQQEYVDSNSYDDFYNQKVDDYLRNMPKGLGKMMGIDSDRLPDNLIKKINNEYQYNMNNYVTDEVLKNKKYDINAREEWVDKLTPSEYEAFADSKYTGKLKPNLWTRTRAGVRALGNTLLPGQPISYDIKGLTPKEQKAYKEDKFAAFDALAATDLPGAWIGNYLTDSRDYVDRPDLLSGELHANLAEGAESLLNPLGYIEGASAFDLIGGGVKAIKNSKQAKKLNKVLENLTAKDIKYVNLQDQIDDIVKNSSFKTEDEALDYLKDLAKKENKDVYDLLETYSKRGFGFRGSNPWAAAEVIKSDLNPYISPYLYHGTSDARLKSILELSLDNSKGKAINTGGAMADVLGGGWTTAAGDMAYAKTFSELSADATKGKPVILRFKNKNKENLGFLGSHPAVKGKGIEYSFDGGKTWNKGINNTDIKSGIKSQSLENEYWPKSLTEHPDMEYVLQKTPVKDFEVRPVIENLPTKKTHGYEVTKDEVYQLINQNLEYITDPEYIKRRQLTTKESPEKIQKEINKYIKDLKSAKIDFNTIGEFAGVFKEGKRKILNPFKKSSSLIGINPNEIKSRSHALHVLDHEIGHALSPISRGDFKGLPKYKNYPNLRIAKEHSEKGYLSSDVEQQVRLNRIKNYLHNKHGVSKNKPLSEEDFKLFTDDYNKWMSESHDGLGKGYIPIGMGDISDMLSGHIRTVGSGDKTRRNVRAAINKSWGLLPLGIGAGLLNNSQNQKLNEKKKGGIVAELTEDEIQDYINQGYVVEEVDEPKMQSGGQLPYQVWQEKTGTPWAEARRQGLTDGSASANIALMNKLLAGETPVVQEKSAVQQRTVQPTSGYEAYDRNVKQMVDNGASLEDLVNIRMGTREGLVNRFPDLFSASNAKSKEVNNVNIPLTKQTTATKIDTIVNKADTANIKSIVPKFRNIPESTVVKTPAPKVQTPIVKKFEKSKIKAKQKIQQKETENIVNRLREELTPDTLRRQQKTKSTLIPLAPKAVVQNTFKPMIMGTDKYPKIAKPIVKPEAIKNFRDIKGDPTQYKPSQLNLPKEIEKEVKQIKPIVAIKPQDVIKLQNTLKPIAKFPKGSKLTEQKPEQESKIVKEDANYKVINNLTQRLNKFDESLQGLYYDYTNPHNTPEKRKQATQVFKNKMAERNNLINTINSKKRDYAGAIDSWIDESAPAWIKKPAQKMDLSDQVEATSYKLPALKTFKQKEEEDNEKFRTAKRVDDLGGSEKGSRWQFRVSASNDDPMKVQLYGTRGERNPKLNIKAKGAVMHFLDQSPLTGYTHPLTKDYYNNLKPDAFVGKLEKQKDGNYSVKYVPKKDIPAKELTKNTFLIRQEKFDNIDFNKKVRDDNFSGHTYWTKKGTNKATIPISSAKDANVYDYSSGQSVVFIFPYKGKTRYVHYAGSPNAIKKEGEEIKKQYKLQANKLVLGVADAGSYSSAVKGNITDKKLKDWNYGYANRNSFTGAGMALVD